MRHDIYRVGVCIGRHVVGAEDAHFLDDSYTRQEDPYHEVTKAYDTTSTMIKDDI